MPSVILPVYGNEEALPVLAASLHEVLRADWPDYELVFVHDASPDKSLTVLQGLQAQSPQHITILDQPRNLGQQKSVLNGLRAARNPITVVMDADLQDQPAQVPVLLKELEMKGGAVFLLRDDRYQGWGRMLTSRLFKLPLYWLSGLHYRAGMFFAMDAKVREKVLSLAVKEAYLTVMVACAGLPVHYKEGKRDKRPFGQSAYNFRGRLSAAVSAFRCWWQCRRA